ncbi:acid sphingomyelinase-like phosphodiesterase 3b [Monodelphis domestica]|nr:acid sphingomyelinase-like phosphodiesterase 3b [Monodelphis domestica]
MKMRWLNFLLFLIHWRGTGAVTGQFWHISDLHLELEYNHTSKDPSQVCLSEGPQSVTNAGVWGNYLCDAPWELINSSIYAMKAILPKPDFILLTGDFTAQIIDEEWTEEAVLIIVKRLTDLLLLVFPDTTVYATLGNHDFYPKDQLPAKSNVIYSYIADLWRPWLDYKSISQFKKGAFYYQNLPGPNSNGQIVVLNTNLYYEKNGAENRLNDPGKQFQWLDTVLSEAFQDGKKVYIIGHMPPGFFEKTRNKAWFRPNFNKRYMEIIKKHYRVIEGQFFGHHHTDSFRMFYDDKDNPVSVMFLTPGVTPKKTTLPGVENGPNNPGIRVWEYDRATLRLKDMVTYYLNLTHANLHSPKWKKEYRLTEAFYVQDGSAASMHRVLEKIASESQFLQKYYKFNSVNYDLRPCHRHCREEHLCAIKEVDFAKYERCIKQLSSSCGLPGSLLLFCVMMGFHLIKSL